MLQKNQEGQIKLGTPVKIVMGVATMHDLARKEGSF